MNETTVLDQVRNHVKQKLAGDGSGHDWWHIVRVVNLAKTIAAAEGGNLFVVELGALLHDIADWKFNNGDTTVGPKITRQLLVDQQVEQDTIEKVVEIVEFISFKGGTNTHELSTLEGKIVQDADRLDAIGAIGIARTFAFGGSAGRQMYDPAISPKEYANFHEFHAALKTNTTVNHFYEKLLLLKDRMNTPTARQMAVMRHTYMEQFLDEFYAEWEGKL